MKVFIPSKDKNFSDSTVKFYIQYKGAKTVSSTHVTIDDSNCNNLKSACCNRGVNKTSLKRQNEKRCPFLEMHFYFKSMLQMKEISVAKVAKGCTKLSCSSPPEGKAVLQYRCHSARSGSPHPALWSDILGPLPVLEDMLVLAAGRCPDKCVKQRINKLSRRWAVTW